MPNNHCNHDQPDEPNWLDETLGDYFAPAVAAAVAEAPSPDFASRCHAAAGRALDVARMRRERPKVARILTSLREHFAALARLAGVRVDEVFAYLTIGGTDDFDAESIRGMTRLARMIGMDREETAMRLRLGFALASRTSESRALVAAITPAFAKLDDSPGATFRVEPLLLACESAYDAARREQVAQAISASASVFASEDEN